MNYKRNQEVMTTCDIITEAITIPAHTKVLIRNLDMLFKSYDIEYQGQVITDCNESDLTKIIPESEILSHLFINVLPQYNALDNVDHGTKHIVDVISQITKIAKDYKLNIMLCWIIAIYHDLGQLYGRENHEIKSAELFMDDRFLKDVLTKDERLIIKEAIEDHRSSKGYRKPRSIYGKAICEADKDLDLTCILIKYIKAGRERYGFSDKELTKWTYNDLSTKYGENGYVTFWLDTERNIKDRDRLREILTSYERFEHEFSCYLEVYDE